MYIILYNSFSFVSVCRRFERLVAQGKSPTVELLYDWGTTNCTVGELVEILISHQLFAPARLLLPGKWICFQMNSVLLI